MNPADATPKRRALGRGLDALIPASPGGEFFLCPVEELRAAGDQPRKHFDAALLDELAASIREQGVVQPLVVRRVQGAFEIIAGERRWRAAQKAGLKEVPVVVKDVSPARSLEMALVENLQRADLSPMEIAEAYRRLVEEHGYTQEQLAQKVGKDRTTVANTLRLLKLPPALRDRVLRGEISEGHARALLSCATPAAMASLADRIVARGLSVREAERIARRPDVTGARGKAKELSANVRDLQARIERALGARVRIVDAKGKGRIEIAYATYDALDRILEKILR